MENTEGSFAIIRDGKPHNFVFEYQKLKDIKVGVGDRKMLANTSSERGNHGRYFFKELVNEEDAKQQQKKWRYFKNHGARVPELFKLVILSDGTHCSAIQDLSENGRYLVVSMNNDEVNDPKYLIFSKKISQLARETIINDMIRDCEVAAGLHDTNGENPEGVIYEFQNNAFMLAVNPTNPDDAHVYVADFGQDIMKRNKQKNNPDVIMEYNLQRAADFYTWMTDEIFQLPNKHPLSSKMNAQFAEKGNKILEYRHHNK